MFSTTVTDTGQITLPEEISRQAGCTETASFDGKLKGEKGFCWLE
jgi:bifunctional DNA-binding transcriptional regulator/antitoxin component of YhaV-PrlF toxin-antitoxin module